MHNFVLSPTDPEKLISSISESVTANILKAVRNEQTPTKQLLTVQATTKFRNLRAVPNNSRGRYTKKDYSKKLFDLLYEEPLSRRMAATKLGFIDQTYMVTQCIYDWINEDKAQVIGVIQCRRSNRMVQAVTTNPKLFISTNEGQLKFDF